MVNYETLQKSIMNFLNDIKQQFKINHDLIVSHIMDTNNPHSLKSISNIDIPNLEISENIDSSMKTLLGNLIAISDNQYEHPDSHPASMITTDPARRFVSDKQIAEFTAKISEEVLDKRLKELEDKIDIKISNTLDNIVNMPTVTNNLEAIKALLDSDATLYNLIKLCNSKLDKSTFEEYISTHTMTEEQAAELKLLGDFIEAGGVDWNADTTGLNGIINKPDKLPADGGNADTIEGYKAKDLIESRCDKIIIGKAGNGYSANSCHFFSNGDKGEDQRIIQNAIEYCKNKPSIIVLYPGSYNVDSLDFGIQHINFTANSPCITLIVKDSLKLGHYTNISNISIKSEGDSAKIETSESCNIAFCHIKNMNIVLSGWYNRVDNCQIFNGSFNLANANKNIISNNLFNSVDMPLFCNDNWIDNNYKIS